MPPLELPQIIYLAVHLCMLAGLLLILFVPFFPGIAVIGTALAAYMGYHVYTTGIFNPLWTLHLVLIALATTAALTTSWWTEKLGFRFTYITREVVWAAFLGMCVGAILNLPLDLQMLFFVLGALLGEIYVRKRKLREALRDAPIAIYSLLGPRGFQLVMAILAVYWALVALPLHT